MLLDMGSICPQGPDGVYKSILWLKMTRGICPQIFHIVEISAIYRPSKIQGDAIFSVLVLLGLERESYMMWLFTWPQVFKIF